ncbi:MAG: hypothetical protein JST73_05575 [Actinobacteria bacterium]|nr:hypothetical protein [Actinomycetota bacterium]
MIFVAPPVSASWATSVVGREGAQGAVTGGGAVVAGRVAIGVVGWGTMVGGIVELVVVVDDVGVVLIFRRTR